MVIVMKRFTSAFLALLAAVLLLSSCTGNKDNSTQPSGNSPSEEQSVHTPTPSVPVQSPTPSPSDPLPTPSKNSPSDNKDDGVAKGKTEEELGVLPVGQYTITPKGTTGALSYANEEKNDKVNISATVGGTLNQFTIVYQTHKENPYYLVFAGDDSMHTLATADYNNARADMEVLFRGKQGYRDGYWDDKLETMQWRIVENADKTYTFYSNKRATNLVLSFKNNKLTLEDPSDATGITSFELKMVTRGGGKAFLQYISDEGNVVVRVPVNTKSRTKLNDEKLQLWANNLDDAYNSYIDLTTFVTHESIVVKAYEQSPHIGYVWNDTSHYNVITIDKTFVITDLTKMATRAKRDNVADWNFCALHEMGHMFDNQRPWYFEAEMMTDLKVAYVLQANGGCAAPSEYAASDYFYADGIEGHKQIEKCYVGLAAKGKPIAESLEYGAYGAALKFIEIQRAVDDANWTVYKQVYAELYNEGITTYKNYERFTNFVDKIAEKSGKDVRGLFTEEEWNVYMTKYGYTG